MNTEETKFYCIPNLIQAAELFARDEESHLALTAELKKNHIPETINLITEASFHSIMAERCAAHCLPQVIASIVSEYDKFGLNASLEGCLDCGAIPKG